MNEQIKITMEALKKNNMVPFYAENKEEALEIIKRVGLEHRAYNKGTKLSGGEKQRCVIARALATDAPILACDEPTGNLDRNTALGIFELLSELRASRQMGMLIVTHDESLAQSADRVLHMRDGVWLD